MGNMTSFFASPVNSSLISSTCGLPESFSGGKEEIGMQRPHKGNSATCVLPRSVFMVRRQFSSEYSIKIV